MKAELVIRSDPAGDGHFGASRGDRTHNGIDYACVPGTIILSQCYGTVSKLGYPYADDLSYRYIEITAPDHKKHRLFYCKPSNELSISDYVVLGEPIGWSQDVAARYPGQGMINHVHYEIKVGDEYIDPEAV